MATRTREGGSSEATAAARKELVVYERLRAGRRDAFARMAVDLDPVLRDLAGVTAPGAAHVDGLVRHTWEVALGGLDLFAWRCSLRAWVAGVLVGWAGGSLPPGDVPRGAPRPAAAAPTGRPGPPDWADLPWGARWEGGWDALARARASLGVRQQQALVLRDGHGWSDRDTCDALGLPEVRYRETLAGARLALHDGLAALAGGGPGCAHDRAAAALGEAGALDTCPACALLAARVERACALVAVTAARPPAAPDPALLAVFRRWRAARRGGLRQRLARLRGGSAGHALLRVP